MQTIIVGGVHKLSVKVTQTSLPQFMGLTSLCICTLNSDTTLATLACNQPGYGSYPTDYVSTNITRVFTLTKRSKIVTPANLMGTWASDCSADSKIVIEFNKMLDQTFSFMVYNAIPCTNLIVKVIEGGPFSIGNAVPVTDSNSGASIIAYELDRTNSQTGKTTYDIVYIDDYGDLYLGDITQTLNGSTPQLRPNIILLDLPFHKIH